MIIVQLLTLNCLLNYYKYSFSPKRIKAFKTTQAQTIGVSSAALPVGEI